MNDLNRTVRNWLSVVFGVDLRSLAVFRVFLGLTVLLDAAMRFPDAEAFYADSGLFSRQTSYQYCEQFFPADWERMTWSLYWISGETWWSQLLLGLQAVAALALLLGAGTRVAIVVCWLLVVSAQVRNPLVITSGDFLLKLMLFWSIFLPLNRVGSIDSRLRVNRQPPESTWYVSIATAGLLLQIILMYFFTGVAKFNEVWFHGQAMDYVLRLELYITPLGKSLLEYPWLLKIVAWGTLLIELIGIWFLLIPWGNSWWRILNLVSYWGFHLGIALSMTIGLFPLICMIAWLPLLPREVWTARRPPVPALRSIDWREPWRWAGIGLLILTLWWNLSNLRGSVFSGTLPRPLEYAGRLLGLEQHFQMFGIPPHESPWFVYETRLANGEKVDIFRPDGVFSLDRPQQISETFPGHNWRKLHQNLVDRRLARFRAALLDYAVRRWNRSHPAEQQVSAATLRCMVEIAGPDHNPINRLTDTWGTYQDPRLGPGTRLKDLEDQLNKSDRGFPF